MNIVQINDSTYNKNILDIIKKFPKLNKYSFTQKIHQLGIAIPKKDLKNERKLIREINSILKLNHQYVKWEIHKRTYNPIEFFERQNVLSDFIMGIYETN